MLIVNTVGAVVTVMVAGAGAVLSRRDCLCGNLNLSAQNCQCELPDLITEEEKREWSPLSALSGFFPSLAERVTPDGCFFNKNHVRLSWCVMWQTQSKVHYH